MKFFKFTFIVFLFYIFFAASNVFANYVEVASYENGSLTITSYSKSWTEDKLKQLYNELLNNFTSSEFSYLKNIYIYPDSPKGINGEYSEDVSLVNGKYVYGENSYINIYNGERYSTISSIAPILSHEYGHHYTIFNLLDKENLYYHNLNTSQYAKIRNIDQFPVYYIGSTNAYEYRWDILELLADDYVQLLGSPNAKLSKDYKSSDELVLSSSFNNSGSSFNLRPSLNPYIPLASQVGGLYSYFLGLGGYTGNNPKLTSYPVLSNVSVSKALNGELSFNISWTEASGNAPFEYTLIMYPPSNPFSPIPLKTVKTGEELSAIFGSYSIKDENNNIISVSNTYQGEFQIKLYIKDSRNFIYETEPISFNFDNALNILESQLSSNSTVITENQITTNITEQATANLISTNRQPSLNSSNNSAEQNTENTTSEIEEYSYSQNIDVPSAELNETIFSKNLLFKVILNFNQPKFFKIFFNLEPVKLIKNKVIAKIQMEDLLLAVNKIISSVSNIGG